MISRYRGVVHLRIICFKHYAKEPNNIIPPSIHTQVPLNMYLTCDSSTYIVYCIRKWYLSENTCVHNTCKHCNMTTTKCIL